MFAAARVAGGKVATAGWRELCVRSGDAGTIDVFGNDKK